MREISVVPSLTHGRRTGLAMLATVLVLGMSIPRASAQLTNGTVLGSVLDPQLAGVRAAAAESA